MSTLKKTIMETSLSKPVQQASTVNKIVAWFFNENNLFTSLMEGKSVTNAKLLCTVNVLFAVLGLIILFSALLVKAYCKNSEWIAENCCMIEA